MVKSQFPILAWVPSAAGDQFMFVHLSFQEFYAARHLVRGLPMPILKEPVEVTVQTSGKGSFLPARLRVIGQQLHILAPAKRVERGMKPTLAQIPLHALGARVSAPKSERKGHAHALRLDLRAVPDGPRSRWLQKKYIVSFGSDAALRRCEAGMRAVSASSTLLRRRLLVLGGSGLRAADSNGMSDPYAVVFLDGEQVGRTAVATKTLDPEWRYVLELDIPADGACVRIEVKDRDWLGKDDPLGAAELHLGAGLGLGDRAAQVQLERGGQRQRHAHSQ